MRKLMFSQGPAGLKSSNKPTGGKSSENGTPEM